MNISVSFEELNRALRATLPIIEDKSISDDMRDVIIWVRESKLSVVACTLFATCESNLDGTVTYAENEQAGAERFIRIRAKELEKCLSYFTSLRITRVKQVTFEVLERELRLLVEEEIVDGVELPQGATEESYAQVSKYRLTKLDVLEPIKKELKTALSAVDTVSGYEPLDKVAIGSYFDALIPLIPKEARDSIHTRLTFGKEFVYTVPQTYAAMMPNALPDVMSDFILTNNVAVIMQQFCNLEDTTDMARNFINMQDNNPHTAVAVQLILHNSQSTVVLKCHSMAKAFNLDKYTNKPDIGVAFDRRYFMDIMKRFNDDVTLTIDVDHRTCTVANQSMTQSIPVVFGKGSGVYSFTIKPILLNSIIFAHASAVTDSFIFMYFEQTDLKLSVICCDDENKWRTRANGLSLVKNDFKW